MGHKIQCAQQTLSSMGWGSISYLKYIDANIWRLYEGRNKDIDSGTRPRPDPYQWLVVSGRVGNASHS